MTCDTEALFSNIFTSPSCSTTTILFVPSGGYVSRTVPSPNVVKWRSGKAGSVLICGIVPVGRGVAVGGGMIVGSGVEVGGTVVGMVVAVAVGVGGAGIGVPAGSLGSGVEVAVDCAGTGELVPFGGADG